MKESKKPPYSKQQIYVGPIVCVSETCVFVPFFLGDTGAHPNSWHNSTNTDSTCSTLRGAQSV